MNIEVGKQLRAVRTAFGLSQRELAKRAGVTNGMVSLIEQDRVSPSVGSLQKILAAFPMTMAEFFTRDMEGEAEVVFRASDLPDMGTGASNIAWWRHPGAIARCPYSGKPTHRIRIPEKIC